MSKRLARNSEQGGNRRETREAIEVQKGRERKSRREPKIIKMLDSRCDQELEDFGFTPP